MMQRNLDLRNERAAHDKLLRMSNWGRWGEDDERGALNLITPECILKAARLIKRGVMYPLGNEIRERNAPSLEGSPPSLHLMQISGSDFAAGQRRAGEGEDIGWAGDFLFTGIHTVTTHIDGLCHRWRGHELFNGFPEGLVKSFGAIRLGIENVGGIATKGILLDVAAFKGVPVLDWDYIITGDDLAECADRECVTVEQGDVVLVRTGWSTVFYQDPRKYSGSQPGIGSSGGLWLAEKGVVAVGSDNTGVEPYRGGRPGQRDTMEQDPRPEFATELHTAFLGNLGIYLIEMLDLEKLAADHVFEFFLMLAPLLIKGGTGSPANPLAIA